MSQLVSWGTAFKTALKIILMSIGFYVLGLIVILAGWAGSAATALAHPDLLGDPLRTLGALGGAVIVTIIGGAIMYIGVIASALKYSAELIADEVGAPQRSTPTPPPASRSTPVETQIMSSTESCPKCGKEMPRGNKFCDRCGTRLTAGE